MRQEPEVNRRGRVPEVKWIVNDPKGLLEAIKKNNRKYVLNKRADLVRLLAISSRSLDRADKEGVTFETLVPVFGLLTDIEDRVEKAFNMSFTTEERDLIQGLIAERCTRKGFAEQARDEPPYLMLYSSFVRITSLAKEPRHSQFVAVKSLHFSEKPMDEVQMEPINLWSYPDREYFEVAYPPYPIGPVLDDFPDFHYDVKPNSFVQCIFMGTDNLTPSRSIVIERLRSECERITLIVDFSSVHTRSGRLFKKPPVCFMTMPDSPVRLQMSVICDRHRCFVDSDFATSMSIQEPDSANDFVEQIQKSAGSSEAVTWSTLRDGEYAKNWIIDIQNAEDVREWEHGDQQWLPLNGKIPKGTTCEFEFFIDWDALQ